MLAVYTFSDLLSNHPKLLNLFHFKIFISLFWDSVILHHLLSRQLFLKYSEYLKQGNFFSENFRLQNSNLSFLVSLSLSKTISGTFRVGVENNGLILMLQQQPCISDEFLIVIKHFHKFQAGNSPQFTFFVKLIHHLQKEGKK